MEDSDFVNVTFKNEKDVVIIDFGGEVDVSVLQDFLLKNLLVKVGEVNFVQYHTVARKVLVGFKTSERCDDAAALLAAGIECPALGKVIFGCHAAKKMLVVNVKNVPYRMNEDEVRNVLGRFGHVTKMKRTAWRGLGMNVWNGITQISMIVDEDLVFPRLVKVRAFGSWPALVWQCQYAGQHLTGCFKCAKTGHLALDCPNVKKKKSYATAVSSRQEDVVLPTNPVAGVGRSASPVAGVVVAATSVADVVVAATKVAETVVTMDTTENDSDDSVSTVILPPSSPVGAGESSGEDSEKEQQNKTVCKVLVRSGRLDVSLREGKHPEYWSALRHDSEIVLPDWLVNKLFAHDCDVLATEIVKQIRIDMESECCTGEQLRIRDELLKKHFAAFRKQT